MPSPPLVVTNAVQVRLLGTYSLNGVVNVLAARKTAGTTITQTLANTVGAAIKAAWTNRIGALCGSNTSLVRVGLRDLTAANQPEFLDTGAPVSGVLASEGLPPQTALCVTLRTAKSGKSFRGRVYVWGFTENENTATGVASTAAVNAATAFITDIQSALATSQLTLAVLSRPSFAVIETKTWTLNDGTTEEKVITRSPARAGGVEPVTIIQSRNAAWETQRRRNNGRGALPTLVGTMSTFDVESGVFTPMTS